jgi:thiamine-phosphate pyrophosphorylase
MQRYAITDGAPGRQVEAWALAGVEWIQIREPGMAQEKLALLGKELATICRKAACAHGVHLHGGTSVAQVHAARAAGALVSVSCHTLADAQHAVQGSANALLWAPVYGKMVDGRVVVPGSGLAALSEACRVAGDTPVFALGGITAQNAEECVRAGAAGVAGIRLFADEQWRSLCARPV